MKELGNLIGGLVSLFFLGAIFLGAIASGKSGAIIFVVVVGLVLYLISKREDSIVANRNRKIKAENDAMEEERRRTQKIENMTEGEFISFIKVYRGELDCQLKNGVITKLGHGSSTKRWSTKKYFVESTIDDNSFTEFISIIRKSDGIEIFLGSYGHEY